jgi:tetratricopeptide (TPR) repeat protein
MRFKPAAVLLCFLGLFPDPVRILGQTAEPLNPHIKRNMLLGGVQTDIDHGANDKAASALEEASILGLTKQQQKRWLPFLADLYIRQGRYDKALPVLHEAVDADFKNWRRHLALGLACYQVDLNDEAISSLKTTVQLNPDAAEALLPLGKLTIKKGFLDEAEKYLQRLIVLEPKSVEGHLGLEEVYEKKGQLPKAIEQLEQAAMEEKDPQIYFRMGLLYAFQGQTENSLNTYRKGQALEPKKNDYDFYAGLTYWLRGDWVKTEKYMTQAIENGRPGALPYFFRSLAYYHQGMPEAARNDAARAHELAQGDFLAQLSEDIIHGTKTTVQ